MPANLVIGEAGEYASDTLYVVSVCMESFVKANASDFPDTAATVIFELTSSPLYVGFRRSLHKGRKRDTNPLRLCISKAASEKDNVRELLLYQRFPHPPHSPPNSGRKRVYIPSAFEAASEENIKVASGVRAYLI
ncbi:hypothetical protein DFS33DRAFT_1485318 [Desarmillaria ectypa]|nr:hypothetical protein DFS33DRAFT_1485318 [Desarmillaria ectypa]